MLNLDLTKIANIVQGHCATDLSGKIANVSIDTRTLMPGDIYIAIIGEIHDGHEFIDNAIAKGAIAIISQKELSKSVPIIVVEDSRKALGDIAGYWRQQFQIPVIGITGSNGKTTVKEMCRTLFSAEENVLVTEKNNNNDIGVPLTLLQLSDEHKFAIIEMGTNHKGEIEYLANIVRPTIAAVTNIGESHLAGFKNKQAVALEKSNIFKFQNNNDVAVINIDSEYKDILLQTMRTQNVVQFGINVDADVYCESIKLHMVRVVANNGVIDFQSEFNLLGTHNRYNLACAVAIAANAGLDGKSIENKVCNIKPVVGRLYPKHINDKFLLIDDTYNANPSSVKQALNILSEQAGFKIFIFGDMAELGDKAKKLHEEIGEYATSRNIDYFIAVGDLAKSAFDCFDGDKSFVQDVSEVAALVNKHLSKEICVLVKASRSMHLDKVTEKLLEMAA